MCSFTVYIRFLLSLATLNKKGWFVIRYIKSLPLFLLFFVPLLHSTTIVLIRNSDGVYIGADSRIVNERGESLGSECKVLKINKFYFAHAGLGVDSKFGFNIQDIARTSFSTDLPFAEQIDNFARTVDLECSAYLHRIKNERKEIFNRITSGTLNIETVVAGQDDDGVPFFYVIKFTAAGSNSDVKISMPVRYKCPGDCGGGKVVAMLGQMSHTEQAVENWAFGMMKNPVKAINFIINREIESNDRVGPPITILKIGYDEITWIQHSELCSDQ